MGSMRPSSAKLATLDLVYSSRTRSNSSRIWAFNSGVCRTAKRIPAACSQVSFWLRKHNLASIFFPLSKTAVPSRLKRCDVKEIDDKSSTIAASSMSAPLVLKLWIAASDILPCPIKSSPIVKESLMFAKVISSFSILNPNAWTSCLIKELLALVEGLPELIMPKRATS